MSPPHPPILPGSGAITMNGSQARGSGGSWGWDKRQHLSSCMGSSTGHTWLVSLTREPAVSVGFAYFFFVFVFFFHFGTVTELAGLAFFAALLLGSPEPAHAPPGPGNTPLLPVGRPPPQSLDPGSSQHR